jgi:hypothetical protein
MSVCLVLEGIALHLLVSLANAMALRWAEFPIETLTNSAFNSTFKIFTSSSLSYQNDSFTNCVVVNNGRFRVLTILTSNTSNTKTPRWKFDRSADVDSNNKPNIPPAPVNDRWYQDELYKMDKQSYEYLAQGFELSRRDLRKLLAVTERKLEEKG